MFKLLLPCAAVVLLGGCASSPMLQTVELTPEPGFAVEYAGGAGEQSQGVLAGMAEFTRFEGGDDMQAYTVDVRIVSLTPEAANKLLGGVARTVGVFSLDNAQAETMLASLQGRKDCTMVAAPRVTIMEAQTGTIEVFNQVSYISGFEFQTVPQPGPDKSVVAGLIADPVINVAKDGVMIGVRVMGMSGDSMQLDLDLGLAGLQRPMATTEVKAFGAPITVQVPVMMSQRMKGSGIVSPTRTLALTGLSAGDGNTLLVLVNARATALPEPPEDTADEPAPEKD
jgi:hypothetical protein